MIKFWVIVYLKLRSRHFTSRILSCSLLFPKIHIVVKWRLSHYLFLDTTYENRSSFILIIIFSLFFSSGISTSWNRSFFKSIGTLLQFSVLYSYLILPVLRCGNGASIFTTSGIAARKFQNEVEAGLVSQSFLLSCRLWELTVWCFMRCPFSIQCTSLVIGGTNHASFGLLQYSGPSVTSVG